MASRLHTYHLKRTARAIGIVAVVLAVVFGVSMLVVKAFTIQQVVIDGQGMTVELDRKKLGTNLLVVPVDRLEKDLLAQYPLLSAVRFEKQFPGTLVIHLVRRKPFAALRTSGTTYLVAETGIVLDNADGDAGRYPLLQFETGPLAIGSIVPDAQVKRSLEFLRALQPPVVISVMTKNSGSSLKAKYENTDIFLPQDGDLTAKAHTLQTIIEGFRIKGTLPSVIDLRFDKPVITN